MSRFIPNALPFIICERSIGLQMPDLLDEKEQRHTHKGYCERHGYPSNNRPIRHDDQGQEEKRT